MKAVQTTLTDKNDVKILKTESIRKLSTFQFPVDKKLVPE